MNALNNTKLFTASAAPWKILYFLLPSGVVGEKLVSAKCFELGVMPFPFIFYSTPVIAPPPFF